MLLSAICPIIVASLNTVCTGSSNNSTTVAVKWAISVLSLCRAQERWRNYCAAAEHLKRIRILFLAEISESQAVDLAKEAEFLRQMEEYMAKENASWKENNSDSNKSKQAGAE